MPSTVANPKPSSTSRGSKPSPKDPKATVSKVVTSPPKDDTAPKGVSSAFLQNFLSKTLTDKCLTTSEALTKNILPETKKQQCAYVTLYAKSKNSAGVPFVSTANVFVSHAWKYKLADLIQTCLDYAEKSKEGNKMFFWIDLFTNNQNTGMLLCYPNSSVLSTVSIRGGFGAGLFVRSRPSYPQEFKCFMMRRLLAFV